MRRHLLKGRTQSAVDVQPGAEGRKLRATSSRPREYVAKVEAELQKICGGVLALTDKIAELSIKFGRRKYCAKTDLNERVKIMSEECGWDGTAMRCHSPETECATVVVDATRCLQYPIETHRARSNIVCGRSAGPGTDRRGGQDDFSEAGPGRIVEQIADVPLPQIMEETVEVIQLVPREQIQESLMFMFLK